jgi:CRP-like cAMP-binding protein
MSEPVTPEFLKTLTFLAPATDEERRRLVPATRIESHPAGTVVFREGDHSRSVFLVMGGTVALEVMGPNHRPQRFQTISTGELLGWSPLLGSGPMTASARALTDVRVVVMDADALLRLCDEDPRFGYKFMRWTAAAIAARLSATRLQMLDVYKNELPTAPSGGPS